eukprot:TRINITY_DN4062_c0_g2_i2.p1 TRINITY_DN4062_c0_g2~~TRINITY_DN4062_c0_g2_i2.p1  ORF type:complete len:547 (+),score=152.78 TRINITY_DN4062_c0_g2_i2:82-1722(+)
MRAALALAVCLAACGGAAAQKTPGVLRVPLTVWDWPPWVYVETAPDGTLHWYGGFLIDLWKELAHRVDLKVEFVPVGQEGPLFVEKLSDNMHSMLDSNAIDAGWDAYPVALRSGYHYTMSLFTLEDQVMLRREADPVTVWEIFSPFDNALWWAIAGAVVFGGASLFIITTAHTRPAAQPRTAWALSNVAKVPTFIYHTVIALFGGDDFDEYHLPTGGRVFRLGLLFLALMFTATYTANLAAFLVRPRFTVHGPTTFDELKHATVCTRFRSGNSYIWAQFAAKVIPPPEGMDAFAAKEWSWGMVKNGSCDAIIMTRPTAHSEYLSNCDSIALAPLTFHNRYSVAILREEDEALARKLNEAVLNLVRTPFYASLISRYMRYSDKCVASQFRDPNSLPQIGLTHMAIPLIFFGVCGVVALLVTMWQRSANPDGSRYMGTKEEVQNEMLSGVLDAKLDAKLDALLLRVGGVERRLSTHRGVQPQPLPGDWPIRSEGEHATFGDQLTARSLPSTLPSPTLHTIYSERPAPPPSSRGRPLPSSASRAPWTKF